MGLEPQIVGNAGLYYVCYRLSCRGWNVMQTARNARGIDIVAYDTGGSRYIGVQVKTLSRRNSVGLGGSLDKIMGDFWIIVDNVVKEPRAFVLLPEEVRDGAQREKGERETYWLDPPYYDTEAFREAWDRVG